VSVSWAPWDKREQNMLVVAKMWGS